MMQTDMIYVVMENDFPVVAFRNPRLAHGYVASEIEKEQKLEREAEQQRSSRRRVFYTIRDIKLVV